MNPRYSDVPGTTSPRPQPEWVKRGWRRRSELEPGQSLMRVELEIERLSAELGALKSAVLYASVHVKPGKPCYEEKAEVALTELYALVSDGGEGGTKDLLHRPEPGEEPGSGVDDLFYRLEPGEKPGGGVGPC